MSAAARRAVALAALAAALAAPGRGQEPEPSPSPSPGPADAIEAAAAAYMAEHGIPGLSLAIVVEGRLAWAKGFGRTDLENDVPASELSVYRLASLSKPITAVAVQQLAEHGQLDIDAPIQKYVHDYPTKAWRVSSRQLLGHLGGVRHYAGDEFSSMRRYGSLREGLEIFRRDPLVHQPSTKFLYSTYGYTLLGCAVEAASGRRYSDYLRERIFGPAGMEATQPDDPLALVPRRARGYRRTGRGELQNSPYADISYKLSGGGLIGTATDMARFLVALQSGLLVRPHTLEQMLVAQRTRDGKPVGYGFGFNVSEHQGRREAWHGGSQQQVSNFLYLAPDQQIGVVFLSNLEEVPRRLDFARQIAALAESLAGRAAQPAHGPRHVAEQARRRPRLALAPGGGAVAPR